MMPEIDDAAVHATFAMTHQQQKTQETKQKKRKIMAVAKE